MDTHQKSMYVHKSQPIAAYHPYGYVGHEARLLGLIYITVRARDIHNDNQRRNEPIKITAYLRTCIAHGI